jgi:hypothetical protein
MAKRRKCRNCPKRALKERTLCRICAKKNGDSAKAVRDQRIKNKLCVRCGQRPCLPDNRLCKICKPLEYKRNLGYTKKKLKAGLCRICGKRKGRFWKKTRCKNCAIRTRIASMNLLPSEAKRAYQHVMRFFKNRCESCGTKNSGKKDWSIDHDHKKRTFRGVLCNRCNVALGMLQDKISNIICLLRYAKKHR